MYGLVISHGRCFDLPMQIMITFYICSSPPQSSAPRVYEQPEERPLLACSLDDLPVIKFGSRKADEPIVLPDSPPPDPKAITVSILL